MAYREIFFNFLQSIVTRLGGTGSFLTDLLKKHIEVKNDNILMSSKPLASHQRYNYINYITQHL